MWPLIPADFVSSDGARLVRPLGTLGELTAHGAALANCLGWGYATRYLCKSSQGTTFIVGLFDAATGADPENPRELSMRVRGQLFGPYRIGGGAYTGPLD
jgi:hypothetical protein